VSVEGLRTMLEEDGVETTEGKHFANLIKVEELGMEESRAILDGHLKDLEERKENLTEEHFGIPLTNVRIAVQEGKHRMVRRMLANCKHPVIELRRERHGSVELNDLAEGEFRNCEENEIEWAEGLLQKK
jgi:pseudouridine synthase